MASEKSVQVAQMTLGIIVVVGVLVTLGMVAYVVDQINANQTATASVYDRIKKIVTAFTNPAAKSPPSSSPASTPTPTPALLGAPAAGAAGAPAAGAPAAPRLTAQAINGLIAKKSDDVKYVFAVTDECHACKSLLKTLDGMAAESTLPSKIAGVVPRTQWGSVTQPLVPRYVPTLYSIHNGAVKEVSTGSMSPQAIQDLP
jgi:hypothetical protein